MGRQRKSTAHGAGWNALAAAVILFAVKDTVKAKQERVRQEARAFLESSACDALLDYLDLPPNTALLALIDKGLDPQLLTRLGGFTSNHRPPSPASRARTRRSKKRSSPETLVNQPVLLVW
jgi:hypothetical protein